MLVLCGQQNVAYATGARAPAADHMRAAWWRAVAVLERGAPWPHLYTEFPEGAPEEIPDEFLHRAIEVETGAGAAALAAKLPAGRIALDDAPFPLWDALAARETVDAGTVLGPAKITKTPDELECIRRAQAINEVAMRAVRPLAVPGVPATELSGAFLRAVAELGATANTVDPVFQVMPRAVAEGPFSITGEPVFPIPTRAEALQAGDVLWIDTGINLHGYASDFGATWIIGRAPDAVEREQFLRWRAIVDRALAKVRAGATAADLVEAAGLEHGQQPWLSYFYLAHGIGTDSAEMPFVGTDLGPAFDAALTLEPGMVLVFEPVVWDDGRAGHRSEEIVAVTDDGYVRLSARPSSTGPVPREPARGVPRPDGPRRHRRAAARPRGQRAHGLRRGPPLARGTRGFSPGCVVVRRTGAVHVLANTDAVVPTGFPTDHLYGVTWNPEKLLASLTAIEGVTDARRVAVDGMNPGARALLGRAAGRAEIVDAGPLFAELWRIPDPESIAGVGDAVDRGRARPRRDARRAPTRCDPARAPRDLRGRVRDTRRDDPRVRGRRRAAGRRRVDWLAPEHAFGDGERVVLRAGALRDGWEASLARTYVVGSPSVEQPAPAGWDELVAACVPGATAGGPGAGSRRLRRRAGRRAWPDDLVLVAGLHVALELADETSLRQDVFRVTDDTPVLVTTP